MPSLRKAIIQLAQQNPEMRPILMPLLKTSAATLDPNKFRVDQKTVTVRSAIDIFGPLNIGHIDVQEASELVENVILQAPMNPLIARVSRRGEEILDGKWRLGVLEAFIKDEFPLTGLAYFESVDLEGKKFSELPPHTRRRITSFNIQINWLELTMTDDMAARYVRQMGRRKM